MSYLESLREKIAGLSLNKLMVFISKACLTGFIYILSKESDFFILLSAKKKILIFSILLFYLSQDLVDYIYNSLKSILNSAIIIFIIVRYSTVVPESRIDRFHIVIRTYLLSFILIFILNISYKQILRINQDRVPSRLYSFLRDRDYIVKPLIFIIFVIISFNPFIMNNLYAILGLVFSLILAFVVSHFLGAVLAVTRRKSIFIYLFFALVFLVVFFKLIRPGLI